MACGEIQRHLVGPGVADLHVDRNSNIHIDGPIVVNTNEIHTSPHSSSIVRDIQADIQSIYLLVHSVAITKHFIF